MSVSAEVRIDYVEFHYVEGGLRLAVDGVPFVRYEGDSASEHLEYLLDSTLSSMLEALETVVQTGTSATAAAAGGSTKVTIEPVDASQVRMSVEGPELARPESKREHVVKIDELCERVIECARKVAWACEADAQAMDWPPDLAEFDHAGEEHYLRDRISLLRRALQRD